MERKNFNNGLIFEYASNNDLPILNELAKEIIYKYYSTFLGKDIVNNYIESRQCENEINENINNCIIMKINNKIIGFSIIMGNKLHLIMVAKKYQNQGYGIKLLKYIENKLFVEYDTIELQSFVKNEIANRFYNKNGWKILNKSNENGMEVYKYIKNKIYE
jgi:ribosomal protein S18 acetylase RimI-like enzyme